MLTLRDSWDFVLISNISITSDFVYFIERWKRVYQRLICSMRSDIDGRRFPWENPIAIITCFQIPGRFDRSHISDSYEHITRDITGMNIVTYTQIIRAHMFSYSQAGSHREYVVKYWLHELHWPCYSHNLYRLLWAHLQSRVPCSGCSAGSSGCKFKKTTCYDP